MAKPTIRQSAFQAGLKCPVAFKLSQEMETKASKAMDDGNIFEGFVFGFKEEHKDLVYNKNGSLKASAVRLKVLADKVKDLFSNGENHKRLYVELKDFILSNEPDFIGDFSGYGRGIYDLKLCKDIHKIWDFKETKEEFFQSVSYTWSHLKLTGEKLPFRYVIIEDNDYEKPIIKIIEIEITNDDLKWFESYISDMFYSNVLIPDCSKCFGTGKFDPRCRYFSDCNVGRGLLENHTTLKFSDLKCDIDIKENERDLFAKIDNSKQKEFNPESPINSDDLEESNVDNLFSSKYLTYGMDEYKGNVLKCRNCFKNTIEGNTEKCPECHTQIKWF